MIKSRKTSVHEISLFYLFTLGGSLFTFGKCGIICFCIAALLGILTLVIALKLKATENRILLGLLFFMCVINGIYTFGKFVYFIKEKQLFHTNIIFIALIFAAVCIYLAASKKKIFLKFSVLSFAVCFIFFALLFFTTVKNIVIKDISFGIGLDIKEIIKVYFTLYFPLFIPVCLFKPDNKSAHRGVLITSITLLVFVVLTYGTFGAVNGRLNSPILALVDTANVGRVYTRLDAFLLCIIYLSCLMRCAVSGRAAGQIIATFNLKKSDSELTKK